MRASLLTLTALVALTLGGCSQVSGWLKGDDQASSRTQHTTLRSTPTQAYGFGSGDYAVELYESAHSRSNYAGYDVVLYNSGAAQSVSYAFVDPRKTEFVKLNGAGENADWRSCESQSRGYLYMSEYDFSLDPKFEVCMRNKGYVLASEAGGYGSNSISAKTAGLRGYSQPAVIQSGYVETPRYRYP